MIDLLEQYEPYGELFVTGVVDAILIGGYTCFSEGNTVRSDAIYVEVDGGYMKFSMSSDEIVNGPAEVWNRISVYYKNSRRIGVIERGRR